MALDEESVDVLRRKPEGEPLAQIARDIAFAQKRKGEQHVLGNRRRRQRAADGIERRAPCERVGAAAERGAPAVSARHDGVEKEALLVRDRLPHCEVRL